MLLWVSFSHKIYIINEADVLQAKEYLPAFKAKYKFNI
jgi:hypothetical protein